MEKSVALLAVIDAVKTARTDPGNVSANVVKFWNRYESATKENGKDVGVVIFPGIHPHGYEVPGGGTDQIDLNPTGGSTERDKFIYGTYLLGNRYLIDHFNIMGVVKDDFEKLFQ